MVSAGRTPRRNPCRDQQQFFELLVSDPESFENLHAWTWTPKATGVRCKQCKTWMGKAFAWKAVKELLRAECAPTVSQPPKNVKLHSTHQMQRKGNTWECQVCQGSMVWKNAKWQLQSQLQRACVRTEGTNQLNRYFGSQAQGSGLQGSQQLSALLATSQPEDGCVAVDFF